MGCTLAVQGTRGLGDVLQALTCWSGHFSPLPLGRFTVQGCPRYMSFLARALLRGSLPWLGPASWKRGKLRGSWALVLLLGWGPELPVDLQQCQVSLREACYLGSGLCYTPGGTVLNATRFQQNNSHSSNLATIVATSWLPPPRPPLRVLPHGISGCGLSLLYCLGSSLPPCFHYAFAAGFGYSSARSRVLGFFLPSLGLLNHGALRQLEEPEGFAKRQLAQAQLAAIKQRLHGPVQE